MRSASDKQEHILWISPYGETEDGVTGDREKIVEAGALPNHMAFITTDRERYDNVFDPHALYIYNLATGELIWKKILGLRWNREVAFSPNGASLATIESPAGPQGELGDVVAVYDVISGKEISDVTSKTIQSALKKPSGYPTKIFFSSNSSLRISFAGNSNKQEQYDWVFK